MEIRFLSNKEKARQKGVKESDLFKGMDNYCQLGFKIGQRWDLIDDIFSLWENISIKNKKVKKN